MSHEFASQRAVRNTSQAARVPGHLLAGLLAGAWFALAINPVSAFDARGGQFIALTNFTDFEQTQGASAGEIVLRSPEIVPQINWDELIVSWNAGTPDEAYLKIEARALFATGPTKYYTMGLWSVNTNRYPRESVINQADADGSVATDTLRLKRPCERLQVRLTLGGNRGQKPRLRFLGLQVTDTKVAPPALPSNPAALGKTLAVPERSQMAYTNGGVLCSPTVVSMILAYWSRELKRPELDRAVPEIAAAVYDAQWPGTGNWPFNTAYAGSYPGIRAYVTRLSDLAEVEEWTASGIPVGLSVCYDRLHHRGPGPNGHLVVCVGFTERGDPIVNDPGTSKGIRRVYPRKDLGYAWASSRNTAYLIYPEHHQVPQDRFGHWDSVTARQRYRLEPLAK